MSPRKKYFDEPLVKVDFLKARFPRTCPVCGAPATKAVRMKIAKTGKQSLRRSWDYVYSPYIRRRYGSKPPEMKVLLIQVCEDHAHPDDGTDRYQSLCLILDGFLLAFSILSLLFIGDRIWRADPIPSWTILIISLFGVAMLFTYVAFSPNVLEKAVKIVGFDFGMQNVLLAFKRSDYREQFMNENQMTAELVSWIMRSDD
ncbi:MAG: hypothetical protein ACXABX_01770 [Candidatus Thorarchaeota archaeon]|jgi:hypothetical protein